MCKKFKRGLVSVVALGMSVVMLRRKARMTLSLYSDQIQMLLRNLLNLKLQLRLQLLINFLKGPKKVIELLKRV
ncbi:MAG: hypothetical protein HFE59_08840 [Clostridiales bacterium]|nr:hypothetical protein [Clostridiales bacterium]